MGNALASLDHLAAPPAPPTPLAEDRFFWLPGVDARTQTRTEYERSLHGDKWEKRWIPVVHIAKPEDDTTAGASRRQTLLYCHGHDVDLGLIHDFLMHLSKVLDVDVLSFDYAGYGPVRTPQGAAEDVKEGEADSESAPCPLTEEQCRQDVLACHNYLVNERGVPPRNIVLYGKSLGSGPACWLAHKLCAEATERATEAAEGAEREWMEGTLDGEDGQRSDEDDGRDNETSGARPRRGTPVPQSFLRSPKATDPSDPSNAPLGGLVLHAAFLSLGDGAFDNRERLWEMHAAPSGAAAPSQHPGRELPIYFIHGRRDGVVPVAHGDELNRTLMKERSKGFLPFWADGGTHWNIEHKYAIAYIKRLQQFLRHCDRAIYGEDPARTERRGRRSASRERHRAMVRNGTSGRRDVSGRDGTVAAPSRRDKEPGTRRPGMPPRGRDAHSSDARAPPARSKSRARQRKQRGTLVMRGGPGEDDEDAMRELRKARAYCRIVGGKASKVYERSLSDSRTAQRTVPESRDPPSTKASF